MAGSKPAPGGARDAVAVAGSAVERSGSANWTVIPVDLARSAGDIFPLMAPWRPCRRADKLWLDVCFLIATSFAVSARSAANERRPHSDKDLVE